MKRREGCLHLRLVILAIMLVEGVTWTIPSMSLLHPLSQSRPTSVLGVSKDEMSPETNNDNDAVLSELDARVLQSMLQDEKLNLQEEENMKRLLERGIKNKEPVAQEAKRATEEKNVETEYSSQILKTLGDTKLWKGLSRNAADWFESAKIWVENKVERDTKLVASLGIFAFERAIQDVKRALPASVVKQVAPKFLLDTTTSANQTTLDIRNQMTTPRDEIQAVTQEIRLIIQSGGDRTLRKTSGLLPSNARGLQSAVSSKQGKDRFLKAYQRRKQTTLLREQESLAQTSARLAGTVIDSAYQVKRELQIEPNQPGYKTKALREGAVQTSRLLASGAKGLLSGAKAVAQAALTDGTTRSNPQQLPSSISPSTNVEGMAATNVALDAALGKLNQRKPITSFIDATIVDATIADVPQRPSTPTLPSRPRTVGDAPINARIPGTSSYNPSGMMTDNMSWSRAPSQSPPPTDESLVTPALSQEEEEPFFFASREAPDFQKEQALSSLLADIKKAESGQSESQVPYFTQSPAATFSAESPAFVETEEQTWNSATFDDTYEVVGTEDIRNLQFDDEEEEDDEDDFLLDDEDPQDTLRRVMAEIVSDEDFEFAVGQAKRVDNTADKEIEDDNAEPSILVVVVLRVLDVLFLILEKIILALPSLLSSIPRVASRVAVVQNRGAGSSGWQTIFNAQRGERRY